MYVNVWLGERCVAVSSDGWLCLVMKGGEGGGRHVSTLCMSLSLASVCTLSHTPLSWWWWPQYYNNTVLLSVISVAVDHVLLHWWHSLLSSYISWPVISSSTMSSWIISYTGINTLLRRSSTISYFHNLLQICFQGILLCITLLSFVCSNSYGLTQIHQALQSFDDVNQMKHSKNIFHKSSHFT